MINRSYNPRISSNPLVQAASLVVLAVVGVGAVLLGAVLLSLLLAVLFLAGAAMLIRVWWLNRRHPSGPRRGGSSVGQIIDAKYEVVEERVTRRRERDSRGV